MSQYHFKNSTKHLFIIIYKTRNFTSNYKNALEYEIIEIQDFMKEEKEKIQTKYVTSLQFEGIIIIHYFV